MSMTVQTLPSHQRRTPSFESTFGAPAAQVLSVMTAAVDDPVSQSPRVGIPVQSVGYRRAGVIVHVEDPFGSGRPVPAVCEIDVTTAVPRERRGLHMSRLGDALAQSVIGVAADVSHYANTLARDVARVEYGGPTSVRVRATVPYLEPVARESGLTPKLSLERLTLLATARVGGASGARGRIASGIEVSHIVACPCVQKTYAYSQALSVGAMIAAEPLSPAFTHSQRCVTAITVEGLREPLRVPDLLHALDIVLVRTMETLPRDAELALVYRAHREPQFIEDALREALWSAYQSLDGRPCTRVVGRSRSLESIHSFDLRARAVLTRADAERCEASRLPDRLVAGESMR